MSAALFSGLQGLSSIFGGLTDQSGYKKVSTLDKGQKALRGQVESQLQQGLPMALQQLQSYLNPNTQAYQDFEAPYLQKFREQDLPMLAERFAGAGAQGGALSSSGFGQAIGGAQAGLSANLAGLKEQMRRASISDILGLYQNQMQTPSFAYQAQGPGMASNIFSKFGGLSNPFGAPNLGGGQSTVRISNPLSSGYDAMFRQQGLPLGAY